MKSIAFAKNEFNTGFVIKNEKELMSLIGLPVEIFYNDCDNGYIYDKGFVTKIDKIKDNHFIAYSNDRILFQCEYFEEENGYYDINGKWVENKGSLKEGMYAGDDMDLLSFNILDEIKLFFLKNGSVLNVRGIEVAAGLPPKTLDHFLKGRRPLNEDAVLKIKAVLKELSFK